MQATTLIVRASDRLRRAVIGEVDLSIYVGPHQSIITFQVMDTHPPYSCLLGRHWIHDIDVEKSTLHQKLKFMVRDKLVIVCGEKDFAIRELSPFGYLKIEEGIAEVPFYC